MRMRSLAVATALCLGLALVGAAPAQAAQSVQLTTYTSSTNGYAVLNASLAFTDQGRGINLSGTITDRCPADSHGAYAIITVQFVGGGWQSYTPQDANGCGGAGSGNSFHHDTDFNVRITQVGFLLQERDNGQVIRSTSTVVYNS